MELFTKHSTGRRVQMLTSWKIPRRRLYFVSLALHNRNLMEVSQHTAATSGIPPGTIFACASQLGFSMMSHHNLHIYINALRADFHTEDACLTSQWLRVLQTAKYRLHVHSLNGNNLPRYAQFSVMRRLFFADTNIKLVMLFIKSG